MEQSAIDSTTFFVVCRCGRGCCVAARSGSCWSGGPLCPRQILLFIHHAMAHAILRSVPPPRPVLEGVPCPVWLDTMGDSMKRPPRAPLSGDPPASKLTTPSCGSSLWPDRVRTTRSTARHVSRVADTGPHQRGATDSASAHASAAIDAASAWTGPRHSSAAASVHAAATRDDTPGGLGWLPAATPMPCEAAASAQEGRVSAEIAAPDCPVAAPAAIRVVATAASASARCIQRWNKGRARHPPSGLCQPSGPSGRACVSPGATQAGRRARGRDWVDAKDCRARSRHAGQLANARSMNPATRGPAPRSTVWAVRAPLAVVRRGGGMLRPRSSARLSPYAAVQRMTTERAQRTGRARSPRPRRTLPPLSSATGMRCRGAGTRDAAIHARPTASRGRNCTRQSPVPPARTQTGARRHARAQSSVTDRVESRALLLGERTASPRR